MKRRYMPYDLRSLFVLFFIWTIAVYLGLCFGEQSSSVESMRFDAYTWHPEHSRVDAFRKPVHKEWGPGLTYKS